MPHTVLSFRENVYALCRRIPRGRVTTYQEIARALGNPAAVRAVGNALHANPTLVFMPCHRVVRSDGHLGGYAAGAARKKELLTDEGIRCRGDRVLGLSQFIYHFHRV